MSQSWDNVTEHLLPACYCTIECQYSVHAQMKAARELGYYGVDHISHYRPVQTHRVMVTFERSENVESTTRAWQRADITSHFARGPVAYRAGLSKCAALAPLAQVRECISMAPRPWQPCLCTRHNNSDQSWVFWTCRRAHLLCPSG